MNQLDRAEYYRKCIGHSIAICAGCIATHLFLRTDFDHASIWAISFAVVGWWYGAAQYWKEQAEL